MLFYVFLNLGYNFEKMTISMSEEEHLIKIVL